jgi:hypothetical protein
MLMYRSHRWPLIVALSVAITLSMAGYAPAALAEPAKGSSATAHDKSVPVTAVKHQASQLANPPRFQGKTPVWPKHASAVVNLSMLADQGFHPVAVRIRAGRVGPGMGRRGPARTRDFTIHRCAAGNS